MTTVFPCLGLAFLGAVAVFLLRADWLMLSRRRIRTVGEVFGHKRTTGDGCEVYMAKIQFRDEYGLMVEFVDNYGRAEPRPGVGDRLDVIYPQGYPRYARVPRPFERLVIYAFLFGTSALLAASLMGWIEG
jgi:hypothetical protein